MSKSLFIQKGVKGEVIFGKSPRSQKWYKIIISEVDFTSKEIIVKYSSHCYGAVHKDELRCLECGGGTKIYVGMASMCRDASEMSKVRGLGLPTYRFGRVVGIAVDKKKDREEEQEIQFEFFGEPSKTIVARMTDLLYWSVPGHLDPSAAAARMGVETKGPGDSTKKDRTLNDVETENGSSVIPPRKRQAPTKFDPVSYRGMVVIKKSAESSDGAEESVRIDSSDDEQTGEESTDMDISSGSNREKGIDASGNNTGPNGPSFQRCNWDTATAQSGKPTSGKSDSGSPSLQGKEGQSSKSQEYLRGNTAQSKTSLSSNTSELKHLPQKRLRDVSRPSSPSNTANEPSGSNGPTDGLCGSNEPTDGDPQLSLSQGASNSPTLSSSGNAAQSSISQASSWSKPPDSSTYSGSTAESKSLQANAPRGVLQSNLSRNSADESSGCDVSSPGSQANPAKPSCSACVTTSQSKEPELSSWGEPVEPITNPWGHTSHLMSTQKQSCWSSVASISCRTLTGSSSNLKCCDNPPSRYSDEAPTAEYASPWLSCCGEEINSLSSRPSSPSLLDNSTVPSRSTLATTSCSSKSRSSLWGEPAQPATSPWGWTVQPTSMQKQSPWSSASSVSYSAVTGSIPCSNRSNIPSNDSSKESSPEVDDSPGSSRCEKETNAVLHLTSSTPLASSTEPSHSNWDTSYHSRKSQSSSWDEPVQLSTSPWVCTFQPSSVQKQSPWSNATSDFGSASTGFGTCSDRSNDLLTSCSEELRYRDPPKGRIKMTKSRLATQSQGRLDIYREGNDDFFLRWKFGERVKIVEIGSVMQQEDLEKTRCLGNLNCCLVASKFQKANEKPSKFVHRKFSGSYVRAFYIVESGPGFTPINVQAELNAIANFSDLALRPGKLASRLELLVSPAARSPQKDPYMFVLPLSHFEEVDLPDNQTEGCGFIPPSLLEELLGGGNSAKEAISVQVRIFAPNLGIFKGELVKKVGIRKIQLPPSMKKVGSACGKKKSFKGALLLFNRVCPSQSSIMMERQLNPNITRQPTKSSLDDLKGGLGSMVKQLLLGCGVPREVSEEYERNSKSWDGRSHAYLTGVCDCTDGGLPEGSVFITGFGIGLQKRQNIFLTRSPCTEKGDARILPVVSQKPNDMSKENWEHLCSLPFGAVMFASPKDCGALSLPRQINDSDLDGDIFFSLWDPTLLSYIETHRRVDNCENPTEKNTGEDFSSSPDDDDELLGALVPISDGKKIENAVITSKTKNGNYIVECKGGKREMSRKEIMQDKKFIEEVVGHRGKGRSAEVEVLWSDGARSWESHMRMKAEAPDVVAEYALQEGLTLEIGWTWAQHYQREAEIMKVQSHRLVDKKLEVEVLFDGDAKTTWLGAKSIDDIGILADYAEKKHISLEDEHWKWLMQSIKRKKKDWLAAAQNQVGNVKHMAEYSRLVEVLHSKHKRIGDINHEDSIAFGRAFKRALHTNKHGGRVPLPRQLRPQIAPDNSRFDKFLEDI